MTALSNADVYFNIGVEFENAWMSRIGDANSKMQIVDLSEKLEKIPVTSHHHHEDKEEGNLDAHVWTSAKNVSQMADTIYETLADIDPVNEADYKANLDAFQQDIDELTAEIEASLQGLNSNKFIVFHPSLGDTSRVISDWNRSLLKSKVPNPAHRNWQV